MADQASVSHRWTGVRKHEQSTDHCLLDGPRSTRGKLFGFFLGFLRRNYNRASSFAGGGTGRYSSRRGKKEALPCYGRTESSRIFLSKDTQNFDIQYNFFCQLIEKAIFLILASNMLL
jgi:hypothetical protein